METVGSNGLDREKYIEKLQFLQNKDSVLKRRQSTWKLSFSLTFLIPLLEEKGIAYTIGGEGKRLKIMLPHNKVWIVHHLNYGCNPGGVSKIFKNKYLTYEILEEEGIKTPPAALLFSTYHHQYSDNYSLEEGIKFGKKYGYPLIVKPLEGQQGKGIEVIRSEEELKRFYEEYNKGKKFTDHAFVQKYIEGKEYRLIYFDGEIISCYEKRGLRLYGDGISTIMQLLDRENIHNKKLQSLLKSELERKQTSFETIIEKDSHLQVFDFVNDASSDISLSSYSEKDVDFMRHISAITGSDYFGIDIITSSSHIWEGYVLEINSLPGIQWASSIDPLLQKRFGEKFIEYIHKKTSI